MPSPSYVHGSDRRPLLGLTVGAVLDEAVGRVPDREALVVPHQRVRWSYRELHRRVERFAAGLIGLGLEPGERIGVWSPNNAEWVVAQFAAARAGLILVNINPAYRRAELEFALNRVGCCALVVAPALKGSNYIDMLRDLLPELDSAAPGALRAQRAPELRVVIRLGGERSAGMLGFDEVAGRGDAASRQRLAGLAREIQFDDPVNIQFTSGTTGAPKAATLTHHNIVNNAYFVARRMALTERDRLCMPVPMYHCFGMVLGTLCCATHGATMVLPSAGFDPLAVLEAVDRERCTVLHGVPTMFLAELDHPRFGEFDLTSLRTGIMAGAPCPVELMKRVMHDMHLAELTIAYGMTETGPVSFQTAIGDPLQRRVATVGRVLPHTEVKIVDEQGQVVPRGTPGELLTRGYCVMRGYWNDPERTAEAIDAAGWIRSGDVAQLDEAGSCASSAASRTW